ncbi:hypothetical protein JTB14_034662 [Gonioctena quinquepunctata]|nr:hypothetical protein JTB14_034662 [Gonioctena quinquepunctata]
MNTIYLIVFIGINSAFAAPSTQQIQNELQTQNPLRMELDLRKTNTPGFADLLQSIVDLLTSFLGILSGSTGIVDIVYAIQNFAIIVDTMINIEAIVGMIPVVGPFLSMGVSLARMILGEANLVAGLIWQLVGGPEPPKEIPPPPTSKGLWG